MSDIKLKSPVETQTPEPEKTRVENRAFMAALVADTTTGLAPLITMTQQEFDLNIPAASLGKLAKSSRWHQDTARMIAYRAEIDAQRHARAAERRQAIEECIQTVFESSFLVQRNDRERCDTEGLVKSLESLRDQPRVSPVPPSGGAK